MTNMPGIKQCKVCPYFDKKQSQLHNVNGVLVNPTNKPFCTLVNDWVMEDTQCEGLAKIETIKYELKCNAVHNEKIVNAKGKEEIKKVICGKTLAFFNVKVEEKGSKIGLMNLRYAPDLMAYRKRIDGLMGFECVCGVSDTRLSTEEFDKTPENFPEGIKTSPIEEAKFNEPTSTLKTLIINQEV